MGSYSTAIFFFKFLGCFSANTAKSLSTSAIVLLCGLSLEGRIFISSVKMVLQSQVLEYHTSNLSWISCRMLSPDWSQFAIDGMQYHSWGNAWRAAQPLKDAWKPHKAPATPTSDSPIHPQTSQDSPSCTWSPLHNPCQPFLSFFKAWPAFPNLLLCFFSHTTHSFSSYSKVLQPESLEVGLPRVKLVTLTESHRSIP